MEPSATPLSRSSSPDSPISDASGWGAFPLVCCINLEERTDRLEEAKQLFQSVGLPEVHFFQTRRRKDVDAAIIDSHMACLERAVEMEVPYVLVFEDDVTFDPDFATHLSRIVPFLKGHAGWEIFHLGAFIIRQFGEVAPHIVRGGMITAHAYVMRLDFAKKILAMRPFCTGMSVDLFYSVVVGNHAYCHTYPLMCLQRPSVSDGTWDKSGKNQEGWLGNAMVFTALRFADKLRYRQFSLFERLKIRNGMTFFIVFRMILRRKLNKALHNGQKVGDTRAEGTFLVWKNPQS